MTGPPILRAAKLLGAPTVSKGIPKLFMVTLISLGTPNYAAHTFLRRPLLGSTTLLRAPPNYWRHPFLKTRWIASGIPTSYGTPETTEAPVFWGHPWMTWMPTSCGDPRIIRGTVHSFQRIIRDTTLLRAPTRGAPFYNDTPKITSGIPLSEGTPYFIEHPFSEGTIH